MISTGCQTTFQPVRKRKFVQTNGQQTLSKRENNRCHFLLASHQSIHDIGERRSSIDRAKLIEKKNKKRKQKKKKKKKEMEDKIYWKDDCHLK